MNISKAKRVIKEYSQARDFLKQYEKCQNAWKDYGFSSSGDFIITLLELEDSASRARILKKFREKVSKGKGKRRNRLSEAVKNDIREKAAKGIARKELARAYGVSYQTISKIINHP
jgi:hypothetical protein